MSTAEVKPPTTPGTWHLWVVGLVSQAAMGLNCIYTLVSPDANKALGAKGSIPAIILMVLGALLVVYTIKMKRRGLLRQAAAERARRDSGSALRSHKHGVDVMLPSRQVLRAAYLSELTAARRATFAGEIELAFNHLSRAHILGQRSTCRHVHVHWLMLRLGMRAGDFRESVGQLSRMVAAALFSRIWVPSGNTGRANVSAFLSMPIPEDLRLLLERSDIE
jgi:Protein of unknown function (DUF3703)